MKLVNGKRVKETAKDKADIEKRKKAFAAKKKAQKGQPRRYEPEIELLIEKGVFTREEYEAKL